VRECPRCGIRNEGTDRFCRACGALLQAAVAGSRRTVTIVFSDLVDSTKLGERLDPETVREALDRYFVAAKDAVERHGGVIEKFIGDAIVAVFGLPTIHEDDALRAVRAAFAMQDGLDRVNDELERHFRVRLQTRTGVNTGEVVAGDPAEGQRLVTGDAVNLAARLEQAASPRTILIGETTHALLRDAGEFERLPPLTVKGKADAVVAHRVLSLAAERAVDHGNGARHVARFVGRESELALLAQELAGSGADPSHRPITIVGEAGIGKSRLVAEALLAGASTMRQLRGRCLPYGDGITYWPIMQGLRTIAGIDEDDDERTTGRKLREMAPDPLDDHVVIEPLVSILVGSANYPVEEVARAFRTYADALADSHGVALLFEDVHWAEPTLLDLIEQVPGPRVSVLCTARPELLDVRPDWSRSSTLIELKPLDADDIRHLISGLSHGDVAPAVEQRLLDAAAGNPFFVEQMVFMLDERGTIEASLGDGEGAIALPPSVAAVLDARLDRLPAEVRDVAERAAVVGAIFYQQAVEDLDSSGADIGRGLEDLTARGLVEPHATDLPGQQAFAFTHILIRDAVSRGTLKRKRAEWHERFGGWIQDKGAALGGKEEFVAYHLEQAHRLWTGLGFRDERAEELAARASELLAIAGRRAADRNDAPAAASLLARALAFAPDETTRLRLIADLALAQLESGSVKEALASARMASEEHDSRIDRATALRARAANLMVEMHAGTLDLITTEEEAARIVDELTRVHDPEAAAEANLTLGVVEFSMGRMSGSAERLDAAAELAREVGDVSRRDRALDWLVIAIAYGPIPVSLALARSDEIVRSTRPRSRVEASARSSMAVLRAMALDLDGARADSDLSRAIYEELGMPLEAAATSQGRAVVEMLAGDPSVVEAEMRRDREVLAGMDAFGYLLSTEIRLAQVLMELGRHDESREIAEHAARELSADDLTARAELSSLEVRFFLHEGRHAEAEAIARSSLEGLGTRDHFDLVPTALVDLADVLGAQGREGEAAGLLHEAKAIHVAKENAAALAKVEEKIAQLAL
jgi:class 3 adenylate cyclase/tetratricopeptide (TPR) repeat protein